MWRWSRSGGHSRGVRGWRASVCEKVFYNAVAPVKHGCHKGVVALRIYKVHPVEPELEVVAAHPRGVRKDVCQLVNVVRFAGADNICAYMKLDLRRTGRRKHLLRHGRKSKSVPPQPK